MCQFRSKAQRTVENRTLWLGAAASFAFADVETAMTRHHAPAMSQVQACILELGAAPLLSISADEAHAQQFYNISGGVILPRGRIAVTSSGTHSVLLFDSAGRLSSAFGRRGEGPREFRTLAGLWRMNDSVLMVADPGKSQLTFITNELQYADRAQLDVGSQARWPAVIGVAASSVIAINGQAFEAGQLGVGVVRPPFEFLRYSHTGTLRDTLLTVPGRAFFVPAPRSPARTQAIPFGRTVLHAVGVGVLATVDTDNATIHYLDFTSGDTQSVALPLTRTNVSRAHIDEYKRQRRASATSPIQQRLVAELDQIPFPRMFPIADQMLVGQDGKVWIREFTLSNDGLAQWVAVSADRRAVCSVRVPANLRLLDATGDRVLAVGVDVDGLETISVYGFRRRTTRSGEG